MYKSRSNIFSTVTPNTRTFGSSLWNILHVNVAHANDNEDEISKSIRGLCLSYLTLVARKLSKPEDGRYRTNHVVFIANKHRHLAMYSWLCFD